MGRSDEQVVYSGIGTAKILGKPLKKDASNEEKEIIDALKDIIEKSEAYEPAGKFSDKLEIISKGLRKFPERKEEATKVLFGIYITSGAPGTPHYVNAWSQNILTTFPEVRLVAGIYESGLGKKSDDVEKRLVGAFGSNSSITQAYEGLSKAGDSKPNREKFKTDIYTK